MREFPSCTPIQTGDSFNLGDHTRYRFVVVEEFKLLKRVNKAGMAFMGFLRLFYFSLLLYFRIPGEKASALLLLICFRCKNIYMLI